MVERILSLGALVIRALQVTLERREMNDQTRKLRSWRDVAPGNTTYSAPPKKAFATRSGR